VVITVRDIAPSALSYNSPNVFTRTITIGDLSPIVSGGTVVSYSISPTLPSGLSFNTTTGVISGTPTVISSWNTYTVTATNSGGSTNFGVVIRVNDLAPNSLSYNSPNVFTLGNAISALSPSVSGGAVVSYSISPALPSGLSFDTTTGVISGTPTAIAVLTSYTVTATNSGGSTSFTLEITVEEALATNENQLDKILLYPNPFVDIIYISGQLYDATFRVFAIDGKFIQEGLIKGSEIDVRHVPSGVYFLEIKSARNQEKIFKIIKR
jgi:hypothetical protein